MKIRDNINPQILPLIEESLTQGMRVFVLKGHTDRPAKDISFAYVCQDIEGAFATINAGFNAIDPLTISAPIKPHHQYGSDVLVDHGFSTHGQVQVLKAVCDSRSVQVRFMGYNAPVVPNFGKRCLTQWPIGGADSFIELTLANLKQDQGQSIQNSRGALLPLNPVVSDSTQKKVLSHV